ncbi:MAG: hypothetical protein WCT30_07205, partial [Desulfurivibrionaceae bacterium]
KRRPTLRESRPSFKEKGDKSCFTVLYYSNKRASVFSFYFLFFLAPLTGFFEGLVAGVERWRSTKFLTDTAGMDRGYVFLCCCFKRLYGCKFFCTERKRCFSGEGLEMPGGGFPALKKTGEAVQKIIPVEANWQCGKEGFFPADCGV